MEGLVRETNQPGGLERNVESSFSAVVPRLQIHLVWPPHPELPVHSYGFSREISIPVTLLEVLAIREGSTALDHFKVDVGRALVDLSHGAPIAVLDLWLQ